MRYLLIMAGSIATNYCFALVIDRLRERGAAKASSAAFVTAIICNLGILIYFKYFGFLVSIIENIAHANFGLREVVLPIGISFFTFQAMSYVIDVYRGKVACQKNPFILALYISFFPQLIAGPIVKYQDVEAQLVSRRESADKFVEGIRRFVYGLGKKVLIANVVGEVAEYVFATPVAEIGTGVAWLGIFAYTLQIYYDFSGYSDMAIGLGKMFGFDFCENFDYPYTALSVREFWRRWHISLSTWFREYVYIPLGGNRKGRVRTCVNLFIVFLLTGIWHGANYTFILWGAFFGVLLVIERTFFGKLLEKNKIKPLNWIYTTAAVMILWVLFRSDSVTYAFGYIGKMFSFTSGKADILKFTDLSNWIALAAGTVLCGFVGRFARSFVQRHRENVLLFWTETALVVGILFLSVMYIISGSFNPFIYFQF